MSVVSAVFFLKLEISELGRTPVQRSTIKRGVSECDRTDSIMVKTWSTRDC